MAVAPPIVSLLGAAANAGDANGTPIPAAMPTTAIAVMKRCTVPPSCDGCGFRAVRRHARGEEAVARGRLSARNRATRAGNCRSVWLEPGGPGSVGHLEDVEAAVAVAVPDLVALEVPGGLRHRVGTTARRRRRRHPRHVEVRDFPRVTRILDVEHALPRQDEAACHDLGVDLARHGAVVAGVSLQAVGGLRVVLLVAAARGRLVDLEAHV